MIAFADSRCAGLSTWDFLPISPHVMLGMSGIISSTRSCQVLTSAVSVIPSDQHAESFPPLHDQDVRSCAFSRQHFRKRHSTCSNRSLYNRASLLGYGGVYSDRTSIPSRPLSTTQVMLPAAYSVFCARLSGLLTGCKNTAMPSMRWMRLCYERIALGSHDIGAATYPKPPRVWATLSDSSINKASRISGTMGLSSPLSISGYTPMTPIWST